MSGNKEQEDKAVGRKFVLEAILTYTMAFLLPHNWTQRIVLIILLYSLFVGYMPLVFIMFIVRTISCLNYLESLDK